MVSSVLAAQKPQQSRLVGGEQAVVQQRDDLRVVLIAGVCNDLKENPTLLLIMRPGPDPIHPTQFKISWISSCSAPVRSGANIHFGKGILCKLPPARRRLLVFKNSLSHRSEGLKSCLLVLYIICFREMNPAGEAVF